MPQHYLGSEKSRDTYVKRPQNLSHSCLIIRQRLSSVDQPLAGRRRLRGDDVCYARSQLRKCRREYDILEFEAVRSRKGGTKNVDSH